jgi:hypothetical protein
MNYKLKMKRTNLFLVLSVAIALFSCSHPNASLEQPVDAGVLQRSIFTAADMEATGDDALQEMKTELTDIERKIIKEGNIHFLTSDAPKTRALILDQVKAYRGYVAEDNASDNSYGQTEYELKVRIPAEQFDALLGNLSEHARRVDRKYVSTTDVTEDFIDAEARLATLKDLETRYRELLRRASAVNEILSVEKELARVRGDIESLEGRLKYMKNRIAYSTLTIVFYEASPHEGFGFVDKLGNAIDGGWTNTLWVVIGLVNIWPFLLVAAAVVYILVRNKKRKRT